MKQPPEGDPYRPFNARRWLILAVLAVLTSITVLNYMLSRRGEILTGRDPLAAAVSDAPRCKPGQTQGCVGGMATIIVTPVAPAGSAAARR